MTIKELEKDKEKFNAKQARWKNRAFLAFLVGVLSWYVSPEVLPIAAGCFGWSVFAAGWYELRIYAATELQRKEAENIEL